MRLYAPAGSKDAEILEEIKPLENELVVTKTCSGVFNGTAFDQILMNMKIRNLIFTGVGTNYCVETSVRDAGDRGYNVILVSDACASMTPEQDRFALEILDNTYCKVKSTEEVIGLIEDYAKPVATEAVAQIPSEGINVSASAVTSSPIR